jgi:hypothetical protein
VSFYSRYRYRASGRKRFSVCTAVVGLVVLSYICGAAAMHYRLPSSAWLDRAFLGGRHWYEHQNTSSKAPENADKETPAVRTDVDRPDKTFDGFTLYTRLTDKEPSTQAFLVNMRHEVVHRWAIDFNRLQPKRYATGDASLPACFFGTYLYPNGDLLVVFHGLGSHDAGLAKLDGQSNPIWFCPQGIHHDVDVAEDGTIYALAKESSDTPPHGLEHLRVPCVVDWLLAFSPEGQLLRKPISIPEAFRDSAYAQLLAVVEESDQTHQPPPGSTAVSATPLVLREADRIGLNDALHVNCVRVLPSDLAAAFPAFKAGQLLVSLRNPSVIAMLDPLRGRVVWAARGPWLAQHDPQFLDNGHLLIFDNLGSPRGSRVLEYDPLTQALPWAYPGAAGGRFYTSERGMNQRLPNGNTFIVNSEGGEMVEVDRDGEIVWSYAPDGFIASARRYAPEQLRFLPPGTHARP